MDKYNWIVERRRKGAVERWEIESYHTSPETMCKAALKHGMRGTGAEELLQSLAESVEIVLNAKGEAVEAGRLSLPVRKHSGAVRATSTSK